MSNKVLIITEESRLAENLTKMVNGSSPGMEVCTAFVQSDVEQMLETHEFMLIFVHLIGRSTNLTKMVSFLKEKSPKSFRILIYEASQKELALYSSTDIHKLLQNPIKENELVKILSHFGRLNNLQLNASIVASVNSLGAIPVLPDLYIRLDKELQREDVSIHRICDIISDDPFVAAKVLHIIYSSFFNVSKNVLELIQAVNFLGLDIVKNLVLYVKVFSVKNCTQEAQSQLKHLRDHSIIVAKVAKAIMNTECNKREMIDSAYIAGLLHDIGKILIIQFSDKQKKLNTTNGNGIGAKNGFHKDFDQMGITHTDIGTYLLDLWSFPKDVIDAISNHHKIDVLNETEFTAKQAVLIANAIINSNSEYLSRVKEVYGEEKLAYWVELVPAKIDAA